MAILKSKQISTHLSGSYVITGSLETTANISGSSTSTGSFGKLAVGSATIQISSNAFITLGSEEGMVKNTRFGQNAGQNLQSGGTQNVLVGDDAGAALTTGDKNVAMGVEALTTATGDQTNTAIGYRALKTLNQNGVGGNVAVGAQAGDGVTTGQFNTLIGYFAEASANDGTNQIVIGKEVTGTGDNQTVIGNSAQTHVIFGGDALISGSAQSTGSFGRVNVNGSGTRMVFDTKTTDGTIDFLAIDDGSTISKMQLFSADVGGSGGSGINIMTDANFGVSKLNNTLLFKITENTGSLDAFIYE